MAIESGEAAIRAVIVNALVSRVRWADAAWTPSLQCDRLRQS
jgi:hypothetical protein